MLLLTATAETQGQNLGDFCDAIEGELVVTFADCHVRAGADWAIWRPADLDNGRIAAELDGIGATDRGWIPPGAELTGSQRAELTRLAMRALRPPETV